MCAGLRRYEDRDDRLTVLDHDVHDLRSLAKVAGYLVGRELHQAVTR